jgi:hypothetical protein
LRISPPRPDFELWIMPSTINAHPGTSIPITAYALRRDGFSDEIALALRGAREGYSLSGGWVPAGQDQVRLTLTVPMAAPTQPFSLAMEGRGMIHGQEVIRQCIPAEDMMQAFFYRHLVPAKDLMVAVTGPSMFRVPVKVLTESPVKVPAGGIARIRIAAPPGWFAVQAQLELSESPDGISIRNVSASPGSMELELRSDAEKAKPGLKGNLILTASGVNAGAEGKTKTLGNQRRMPLGTLATIPFEIVQ